MKHLFTVFTPTHNRAHLIHRLYESLKRQTFKDFVWLVVDDGSKDNTKEVIDQFIAEGIIDIKYHFIPDGFLYLAERYSATVVDSEYIIRIDDDDWLLDECLEIYLNEWKKIEAEGISDIGEIRALAAREDGKIAGNYQPIINSKPIDTTYIERELKSKTRMENNACRKVSIWKQLFHDDDTRKWLFNDINYFEDCILWFRLSRLCRSRYIFVPVRLYYDNPISITHSNLSTSYQHHCNTTFGSYMILNEMRDYYWQSPIYFLKRFYNFGVHGFKAGLNFKNMYTALDSILCKSMFLFFSPFFLIQSKR